MRKTFIVFFLFLGILSLNAQDSSYVRSVINDLSSVEYFGRGYVKNGCEKSAVYLEEEMKKSGLLAYNDSYSQYFEFRVNTFPENVKLSISGKELTPGIDYIPDPDCGDISGEYENYFPEIDLLADSSALFKLASNNDYSQKCITLALNRIDNKKYKKEILRKVNKNYFGAKAYIILTDRYPVWGVGHKQNDFAIITMREKAFPKRSGKINLSIDTEMENVKVRNLIGYIPGKTDKTIVFTAHYDHLGGIGDNLFIPGAHDNASGTAMCLDIAMHYNKKKPDYNIVIMLFAGEEAGLLGSSYYTKNPLFPLDKIDFVINLDLVGTGEEGITIVNAADELYEKDWKLISKINDKREYLPEVKARGVSMNSDHYPFHEKGVKSFFIYSRGGNTYYHHVWDDTKHVSLGGYEGIFKLVTDFADKYD